jgi:uncharacterized repeat protein (TIGR01451 family)
MKKALLLFMSAIAWLWSFNTQAQCEIFITQLNTSPCTSGATGTSGFIVLSVDGNCPNAASYTLNWNTDLASGSPTVPSALPFVQTIQFMGPSGEFCAVVNAFDSEGVLVGQGNMCVPLDPPAIFTNIVTTEAPACSDAGACLSFEIVGGMPPFSYNLYGNNGGINNPPLSGPQACNLQPGTYTLMAVDAMQCFTSTTITIEEAQPVGLNGYVFNDLNSDGAQGSGVFEEDGLANQPLVIQETGDVVYTNANGYFSLPDLPVGTYTVTYAGDASAWQPSLSAYTAESPGCLAVPLSSTTPIFDYASQIGSGGILHCTNGSASNFWVANTGNTAFNVRLELNFDASLTAVAPPTGLGFTSAFPGQLVWEYEAQMPGTSVGYNAFIEGPGVGLIGQNLAFSYTLVLSDADGNVIFEEEFNQNRLVACAYDPNDKEGLPLGMGDGHYVPAGTVLTYRIRFQNTGNFPAERVEIVDQLDVAQLNLSTFTPLHSSHDMVTELSETGEVRFIFDNIQLPDSTSNEPESHGYVFYSIQINPEAEHDELITNEAAIYFDANPPIITNETEHRVYDCNVIPQLEATYSSCQDGFFTIDMTTDAFNTHNWSLDGVTFSTSAIAPLSTPFAGDFPLQLTIENEYCSVTSNGLLTVDPTPDASIDINGLLIASPANAANYQWFHNGNLVENENGNTLEPIGDLGLGEYIVIVTSAAGCVGTSEPFYLISVDESSTSPLGILYPNPMNEIAQLFLGEGTYAIELYSMDGKCAKRWENQKGNFLLQRDQLSSGVYQLRLTDALGKVYRMPVVMN